MNLFRLKNGSYSNQKFSGNALPLFVLVLACFAISPIVKAVVPAPDGGYPGANTAEGQSALLSLTIGAANTAVGWRSLFLNNAGSFNTGVGGGALALNRSNSNTAVGAAVLLLNATGSENTAIGTSALLNSSGNANTAIGFAAGLNVVTASNVIAIGPPGADVSNTAWMGNVYGVTTQSGNTAQVVVSDAGQLGMVVSSERFKKDIVSMDKASEAIMSLRPVTFHYKTDTKGTPQFGLIAEEVAKVNPALVLSDKEGKPYTVRYDAVNTMLLNEFIKEYRKLEEQESKIEQEEAKIAQQQKQIEALTAGLQKVSAQLEASKRVPQTLVSNP